MGAPERDALSGTERRGRRPAYVERMRVRVGACVALGIALVTFVPMLIALVERRWPVALLCGVTCLLSAAAGVHALRAGSARAAGLVVLAWMFALFGLVAGTGQGLAVSVSAWPALFALLALYMLGTRQGVVFLCVALAQVGVALLTHRAGPRLDFSLSPWDSNLRVGVAACAIALIGLIGYLYEAAQQRTQAELEDALAESERHARQRDALIESASSAICSVDGAGRLQVHNHAFEAMAGARPRPGDTLSEILDPAQWARWQPHLERVLAGAAGPVTIDEPPAGPGAPHRETTVHPMVAGDGVTGATVFSRDITARKRAEAELRRLSQELVLMSREAGMASVAGEVLHNAGNVLNSAGVSASLLERHVKQLRTGHLARLAALLEEHAGALDAFLRDDPRGRLVPEMVRALADHFEHQQAQLGAEVAALQNSIEHLARVIHAQQSHARGHGIIETVTVAELIDAALTLQAVSWSQLGIALERERCELPPLYIDKHKVIEILVNLISNARHALQAGGRTDKHLRIRAEAVPGSEAETAGQAGSAPGSAPGSAVEGAAAPQRVRIHVEDNGMGIAPEHRARLFQFGFTTRQEGSGIGLHSSANAAQQLGGALSCESDGAGRGARFTLELPVAAAPSRPPARGRGSDEQDEPGAGTAGAT